MNKQYLLCIIAIAVLIAVSIGYAYSVEIVHENLEQRITYLENQVSGIQQEQHEDNHENNCDEFYEDYCIEYTEDGDLAHTYPIED